MDPFLFLSKNALHRQARNDNAFDGMAAEWTEDFWLSTASFPTRSEEGTKMVPLDVRLEIFSASDGNILIVIVHPTQGEWGL